MERKRCSASQACQTLGLARSTYYRKASVNKVAERLERRVKALSRKHPRYGYRLITQLLRNEGWQMNRKRVRRQAGLQVVKRNRKTRRPREPQAERMRAEKPRQVWSYDFIHDQLENGVGLKMWTVLDEYTGSVWR